MSQPVHKAEHLKQLLRERGLWREPRPAPETLTTGVPLLDRIGLPRGQLTEIICPYQQTPGGTLLLSGLLHRAPQVPHRVALVDGNNAFDPSTVPASSRSQLLWVRCKQMHETLAATDLLVRDGNATVIVLLLILCPPAELQQAGTAAWHRLQLLGERNGTTLIAFTPHAAISQARLRLRVRAGGILNGLERLREELWQEVDASVLRCRNATPMEPLV